MLPQAIVLCPQALSICAINSVVVVLPLVPVMPMTGRAHGSPAELELADRRDFLREKFRASGRLGIDPRAQHAEIVDGRIFLRGRSAEQVNPLRAQIVQGRFQQFFLGRAVEHRHVRAFLREEQRRRFSAPARAEDRDIFVSGNRSAYLSFKVASPRSAKMIERIQNRTMTVFSFQPLARNDDGSATWRRAVCR